MVIILFSIEPKRMREDLYNFDHELGMFIKFLRGSRLTLVTGLRRTGKTSLMRVALMRLVLITSMWMLG